MPLLSILLPTYNGRAFLDEQMASILAQTVDDFELLMVDDGSTDGTPALLADYAARDRRIRLVPSHGNLGQVNRLNQLMTEARGKYYAIADQDDVWALDKNERLLAAIGDKAMAFGRSDLIDRDGKPVGRTLLGMLRTPPDSGNLHALFHSRFSAHGSLIRRSWMNGAAMAHALPFDWLIGIEACYTTGAAYADDAVVNHRIHGGNQMNNVPLNGRKLDIGYFRWLFLYRRSMRLRLWLVLEFMSRSAILDPAVRRDFKRAADRAYSVWYSEWQALRPWSRQLRDELSAILEPYASSAEDLAFFRRRVQILTGPSVSPAIAREAHWRAKVV